MFRACQPKEGSSNNSLELHIQWGKQILPWVHSEEAQMQESMASLSFAWVPSKEREGCGRCQQWGGRGACSDCQAGVPCCSVTLLTCVKAPRFALCLTDWLREMADNEIAWECPIYSKLGTEFWRKLCKKELLTIWCVWKNTHSVCGSQRSEVEKCYRKHLPDSAVS